MLYQVVGCSMVSQIDLVSLTTVLFEGRVPPCLPDGRRFLRLTRLIRKQCMPTTFLNKLRSSTNKETQVRAGSRRFYKYKYALLIQKIDVGYPDA